MLARLMAWLRNDNLTPELRARCEDFLKERSVHRLDHIRRALDAQEARIRRTTGYQPRDTGPQGPPPRGGPPLDPPLGSTVPPITEGRVNKGGVNATSRITVRPAPPAPMRPSVWVPQTTLNIPMPAGAKTPPPGPCPHCGK